jgi:hypothetical protein
MQDTRKIMASSGGAVSLSLLASFVGLCCIGPWSVALLGVSGAVFMAHWAPYRFYVIGIAGLMLAWGFWRTYRLKRVCVAEGCPEKAPGPAMHISLWATALLLVLALFATDLQWLLVDPTPVGLR